MLFVPTPDYERLATSVLNATFLQSCTCIHMALTGNAVESLVIAAVAHFCPMLTLTLGIKPDIQTDGFLIVTDKPEDIKEIAMNYSSILMFYTGHQMTLDTDRTLAVLAVVQERDTFLALDAADKTVLGQWNPNTNLIALVESPWLQVIRKSRLKCLRAPKVAIFECPPFVTYHNESLNANEKVHYDGIEFRIVQAALRNFNIRFVPQNSSILDGSWDKVIDDLASGEADVGVCSIWLSTSPAHGLQLSYPWSRQRGTFLAPKPQPLSHVLLLYLPLQFWTWIILFNTLLSFSLILHGVAKFLPLSSRYQNIHNCFFDVSRIFMLNSLPKFPHRATLRYLLTAWAFFSLLTITVYSSGFTSLLMSPLYSKPIDTIQDLLDHNIFWGEQSTGFNDLIISSDNPKLQEFGQKFIKERSPVERENRILKGNYAIFCKVILDTFVTESERLSPRARKTLRVMKEPVFIFYVGIGLRENSPYKSFFDSTIIRLEQSGLTDFWQHLVIYKLGYHYMNTFFTLQNEVIHRKPLSLNSVQGAFYLLGTGLTISGLVFLCETLISYFAPGMILGSIYGGVHPTFRQ